MRNYENIRCHQKDHLQKTQRLAREKLGITLQTFGAPGNAIDDATCRAIDKIEELDIWLYGNSASKKHVLKRHTNIEYPTHNPDFQQFLNHDHSNPDCLVLQVHPNSWDDRRFSQFDQIIQFLKHRPCSFTTPIAYHRLCSGA